MGWRRGSRQVHKWLGLLLAIPVVVLSLSGAALLWPGALDRLSHPQRYATSGIERLQPGDYAAAVTTRLQPGERIARLTLPQGRAPVIVTAGRLFYLDPPTARVLDVVVDKGGLPRTLRSIHSELRIAGWGGAVVVIIGATLLLLVLSGFVMRRPICGRRSSVHRMIGFVAALPLALLSLTGTWLAVFDEPAASRAVPRPAVATRLSVDDAAERATALRPGVVRAVDWPTERKPDWHVAIDPNGAAPLIVAVADDEGIAALAHTHDADAAAPLWRRLHDGVGLGTGWRIVLSLIGLLTALLTVSGLVVAWRSRPARLPADAMLP